MKFRKKPVVIEAEQYNGTNSSEIVKWADDHNSTIVEFAHESDGYRLIIPTLEGDMEVRPGDFVIRGVKGEFYPCKPDIFEATYELVKEGD